MIFLPRQARDKHSQTQKQTVLSGKEDPNSNAAALEAEAVERAEVDMHIDNFSLLPPSADPAFGLLFFWFYLEDAPAEFGPTRFWPTTQVLVGNKTSMSPQEKRSICPHRLGTNIASASVTHTQFGVCFAGR
eukprot:COSAG06_NODE_322_length_17565_cov_152.607752_21_plen_132_part_00